MNRKLYIIIIAVIFFTIRVNGQTVKQDISLSLENLFNRILNSNNDDERLIINDSVRLIIDDYATSDSVFTHRFTNLRYLGQIKSPDSRIKVITWNLALRNGGNKYFLYILRKGYEGSKNHVYKLVGENHEEVIRTDINYFVNDWYGALYYAIQPFRHKRSVYYILLGLDKSSTFNSRKIIEVLSFSENGEIVFGKDCLIKGDETKFREVIEYSSEGVVTLRLDSKRKIVFDHLAPITSVYDNFSENFGAGLSFDGYVLKKGMWRFVSNVDVKNKK